MLQAGRNRKSRGVSFHAGPPSLLQALRTSHPTADIAARLSRRVYIGLFWEVTINDIGVLLLFRVLILMDPKLSLRRTYELY